MPKTLLIVESPAKAKTIGKYLGKDYTVIACKGHVRDLPKSQIGVEVSEDDVALKYITIRGKAELLKSLKTEAAKNDRVYLATDPDREGEAIAWHLQTILDVDKKKKCRVEFNEITKSAVTDAVKHPRTVDVDKVDAQQARRVLDRIVGYKLSPLLWRKVRKGLSAGRVQSVALRIICDREKEIADFTPEEYWTLNAKLSQGKDGFLAKLVKEKNKKPDLSSIEKVEAIKKKVGEGPFKVTGVVTKEQSKNPAPPFTTSSMQMEANRKLNFTSKRTMSIAQALYEGLELGKQGSIGLITYMRTDSLRISDEAQGQARDFIISNYGDKFVPAKPREYVKKGKIQDAHEAIRPTSVERTPEYVKPFLTTEQFKLYKLIWERFVASQMAAEVLDVTTAEFKTGDYLWRATGNKVKFAGYTKLYSEGKDLVKGQEAEEDTSGNKPLPPLKSGDVAAFHEYEQKQHFTEPEPRYSEASLIKTLEELGVGRPSTYAPTIDTILTRGYVEKEKKLFIPTQLGFAVIDLLKDNFPNIIDKQFTANMENQLDEVAIGAREWKKIITEFYFPFMKEIDAADSTIEKIKVPDVVTDEICPNCGRNLVVKNGRFGKFLACPGFPECRYTKRIVQTLNVKCPKCGKGDVIVRQTKKHKNFYGCSNYPDCDYISWYEPVETKCPVCGKNLVKKPGPKGGYLACETPGCTFKSSMLKKDKND